MPSVQVRAAPADLVAVMRATNRTGAIPDLLLVLLSGCTLLLVATPAIVVLVASAVLLAFVAMGVLKPLLVLFAGIVFASSYVIRRLRRSLARGRGGLNGEEAKLELAARSAGGVTVYDPALVFQDMVLHRAQAPTTLPGDAVPGLASLVEEAIAALGADRPTRVLVVPKPWAVWVSPDGTVAVGSAALAALSVPELRALIVYQWVLGRDRGLLRTARIARLAVSTGGFSQTSARGTLTERIQRPVNRLARLVERRGLRSIAVARQRAVEVAGQQVGPEVVASARNREAIALTLWSTTVANWQRRWLDDGDAVRPYADWEAVMADAADRGRSVRSTFANRIDPTTVLGWAPDDQGATIACPPRPSATALAALAPGARLRDQFDDVLAAAYFDPDLTERTFNEHAWRLESPADWAALLEPDGNAEMPTAELLRRQVDALEHAMHRRDAKAREVARRIEAEPATETVRAMAVGVAYLAGEEQAAARITSLLKTAPTSAPVLAGLRWALRARGEDELADQIEAALAQHALLTSASLGLKDLFAAHRRIHRTTLASDAACVIAEVVAVVPCGGRAWLLDVASPDGVVPAIVIRDQPGRAASAVDILDDLGWICAFAAPGIRFLDYSDLEPLARLSLDRRATRLEISAPRGRLRSDHERVTSQPARSN